MTVEFCVPQATACLLLPELLQQLSIALCPSQPSPSRYCGPTSWLSCAPDAPPRNPGRPVNIHWADVKECQAARISRLGTGLPNQEPLAATDACSHGYVTIVQK